jgi:hypothetical protein
MPQEGYKQKVISTPVEGKVAEHHMICNADGADKGAHEFSIMAPKDYGKPQVFECPWCDGAAGLKASGTAEVDTQHGAEQK